MQHLRKGDLIATIDGRDGSVNDEIIRVLEDGEEVPAEDLDQSLTPPRWSVNVRHLRGYWGGHEHTLLLGPDDYVTIGHDCPAEAPTSEDDYYPPTVWSRYRDTGAPVAALLGMAVVLVADALNFARLQQFGLLFTAVTLLTIIPAAVLEYRADMRYDRAHPEADNDQLADEVPA